MTITWVSKGVWPEHLSLPRVRSRGPMDFDSERRFCPVLSCYFNANMKTDVGFPN